MTIFIQGLGNTDNFITEFDGEPFEGGMIRSFDPKTQREGYLFNFANNRNCYVK